MVIDFLEPDQSQSEVAAQLGITRKRVSQLELAALAKLHVLWMGDELDHGRITEEHELRLLIAHCKNSRRRVPRPPRMVTETFYDQEKRCSSY